MLLTVPSAVAGPASPIEIAFYINTIPIVLMMLPNNPIQKRDALNSTVDQ